MSQQQIGERSFTLIDPPNVTGAAPLVLALHGGFGNARSFSRSLPLDSSAARRGFRVAYLNGTGRRNGGYWNAGNCCGQTQSVDDVGYITDVIDALTAQGMVSSVSMVGHSNGAMMIYRYLCEGGHAIESAVVISGSKMNTGACRLKAKTRLLVIHGEADPNVPVAGGKGSGPSGANYTALSQAESDMTRAGADVRIEVLPGVGHRMRDISAAVRNRGRFRLPGVVSAFLVP